MIRPAIQVFKLSAVALFAAGALAAGLCSHGAAGRARASSRPAGRSFRPVLPRGLPLELWVKSIPADNPMTAEKVALGEALFFDRRLSADGTVSCATCHDPASAFADPNSLAVGVGNRVGTRNAPTILNAAFSEQLFWDGRARSLEEQAAQPLANPSEMGQQSLDALVTRLEAVPEYRRRFRQVFGDEGLTSAGVVKALAAFERTQLSGNSPFDAFIGGDAGALNAGQRRGWELFRGKAGCIDCHAYSAASPFFTDFKFHNTGIAARDRDFDGLARAAGEAGGVLSPGQLAHTEALSELGRYLVTRRAPDSGAFKTPGLRDVELTAPYMHNGAERTLLDVVRFYNRGGGHNPYLDERMRPLGLSEAEMSDLVEFMKSLSSDDVIRRAQTARPQTRAR